MRRAKKGGEKKPPQILRCAHPAPLRMTELGSLLLVAALSVAGMQAGPPIVTVPPALANRVIYYNGFELPGGKPEIDKVGAQVVSPIKTGPVGLFGKGLLIDGPNQALHLRSPAFSAEKPVAFSWWWALRRDAKIEDCIDWFLLRGRGIIADFSRGKGEWCALQKPAGVVQVYYFPGIQNVNGIYDYDLAAHLDLRKGVWHQGAMVITGGTLVQAYTDGKLVFSVRTRGRPFSAEDHLQDLTIGSAGGYPMVVDEVMAFNRGLSGEEIGEYYTAIRQMKEAGY